MSEHDAGDEDRSELAHGCGLCGGRLRRDQARQVPLLALDDAFETTVICGEGACMDLAKATYRVSSRRVHARWWQDRDAHALMMQMEAE